MPASGGGAGNLPVAVRGVLITESRRTDVFDQEDSEVLTAVAQHAGLAIEKARQLLVKLLEPLGFELREACNGQEAIETWEQDAVQIGPDDVLVLYTDGITEAQRDFSRPPP